MTDRVLVPLSGGKDSQLTLSLAVERYGAEHVTAVHNWTGIDHSLTYDHMAYLAGLHGVDIVATNEGARYADIFDLIEKRDMIPGRQARLCTDEFKIQAMNRWLRRQGDLGSILMLMGMRAPESRNRMESYGDLTPDDVFSLRDLFPSKTPKYLSAVRVQLPIVTMTTPAVFVELRRRGERVNPLYARGHKRVGCYPCLLAGPVDFRLAARDPEGRQTIIKLDRLRDKLGIVPGHRLWDSTLGGQNLKQLLVDEDPANPNRPRDPFGLDDYDEDPGCGVCA